MTDEDMIFKIKMVSETATEEEIENSIMLDIHIENLHSVTSFAFRNKMQILVKTHD